MKHGCIRGKSRSAGSRDDLALAGVHTRGQGRTPSASGREERESKARRRKQSGAGQTKKPHAAREGTCESELFATKQLMERHESVVQGATDRRERREVPSSFDKHQSEKK